MTLQIPENSSSSSSSPSPPPPPPSPSSSSWVSSSSSSLSVPDASYLAAMGINDWPPLFSVPCLVHCSPQCQSNRFYVLINCYWKMRYRTWTPRISVSWLARSMDRLREFVTKLMGTLRWPRLSSNFRTAFDASGMASVPLASTPSTSKQTPNDGWLITDSNRKEMITK